MKYDFLFFFALRILGVGLTTLGDGQVRLYI